MSRCAFPLEKRTPTATATWRTPFLWTMRPAPSPAASTWPGCYTWTHVWTRVALARRLAIPPFLAIPAPTPRSPTKLLQLSNLNELGARHMARDDAGPLADPSGPALQRPRRA